MLTNVYMARAQPRTNFSQRRSEKVVQKKCPTKGTKMWTSSDVDLTNMKPLLGNPLLEKLNGAFRKGRKNLIENNCGF